MSTCQPLLNWREKRHNFYCQVQHRPQDTGKSFSGQFVHFLENLEFHHMSLSCGLILSQCFSLHLLGLVCPSLLRKREGVCPAHSLSLTAGTLFPPGLSTVPFLPSFPHLSDFFSIIRDSHRCFSDLSSGCTISSAHREGNITNTNPGPSFKGLGIIVKEHQTLEGVPTELWENQSPLPAICTRTESIGCSDTRAGVRHHQGGLVSGQADWLPGRQSAYRHRPSASLPCALLAYFLPRGCVYERERESCPASLFAGLAGSP